MRKRKLAATCFTVLLFVSIVMRRTMFTSMAREGESRTTPYYKSIRTQEGDSLWGIARRCGEGSSMSMEGYVDQLRQVNDLKRDAIHTGQYLTVVYFE